MVRPLLMTTRFNDDTWIDNCNWRMRHQLSGAYYNTSFPISEKIPKNCPLYVLEMNNTKNKIMGIGIIQNHRQTGNYYKIYDNDSLNRYHYQSKIRISREQLSPYSLLLQNGVWISLLECLEYICFKGSRHSKRGMGINRIPSIYFKGTIMKHIMSLFDFLMKNRENVLEC